MDTIFAVSSGAPPAAIAVLRISGPGALAAASSLAGSLPSPRRAGVRSLRRADGALLDQALVLVFPGPHSATGEDLIELHVHGGRAVVRAVEQALGTMPELRPAAPGEFTRRAVQNGRIDLLEAEGLGDLLAAETEHQRRAALQTASGALSRLIARWSSRCLTLAAEVEAEIDFSDEDDVPALALGRITRAAVGLSREIGQSLAAPAVDRLRDGFRIVIGGPRNAGKSTLLNAMAGRDAAIVSSISGTTRDRIEVPVVRDGIAYILIDTAGLADATDDEIEAIGIGRARRAINEADLVLWLGDDAPQVEGAIWVHARADRAERTTLPAGRLLAISAQTGEGVARLWAVVGDSMVGRIPPSDAVAMTERQRALIEDARRWLATCDGESDPIVAGEKLRLALKGFDAVTGKASTEDMLDALFARFCIGK